MYRCLIVISRAMSFWERPPSRSVLSSVRYPDIDRFHFESTVAFFRRQLVVNREARSTWCYSLSSSVRFHLLFFICFAIPNFFVSNISFIFPTWCIGVWLSFRARCRFEKDRRVDLFFLPFDIPTSTDSILNQQSLFFIIRCLLSGTRLSAFRPIKICICLLSSKRSCPIQCFDCR
jgi:hypothetical protein